jgi:hypothetical protein
MNFVKKLLPLIAGGATASVIHKATPDRPKGSNPNSRYVAALVAAVVAAEYVQALVERKLQLTDD